MIASDESIIITTVFKKKNHIPEFWWKSEVKSWDTYMWLFWKNEPTCQKNVVRNFDGSDGGRSSFFIKNINTRCPCTKTIKVLLVFEGFGLLFFPSTSGDSTQWFVCSHLFRNCDLVNLHNYTSGGSYLPYISRWAGTPTIDHFPVVRRSKWY